MDRIKDRRAVARWRGAGWLVAVGLLACCLNPARAQEAAPAATPAAAPTSAPVAPAAPATTPPASNVAPSVDHPEAPAAADADWMARVDRFVGERLVAPLASVLFFDFGTGWLTERFLGQRQSVPFVVAWLFLGAVYLTLRMSFINLRGFWHALLCTSGRYDNPADEGEVSHFQALSSALSATVGLGNIAGVAIAVGTGGPGAVFWLIVAGLLGMTSKFTECTLAVLYRRVDRDGVVSGGPMHYLRDGLNDLGLGTLGTALALVFTVLCIGGSFGGGCTFQVRQSMEAIQEVPAFAWLHDYPWAYGLTMVVLVGIVIIGGIKRIASTADKIVPLMCGLYVLVSLVIVVQHQERILPAVEAILRGAFTPAAAYGGFLGVLVTGIKRAAFSNEAGVGSAAIAHSAARTDEPIREGIVALLEPFIDTVVVCSITGLVMVVTGVYDTERFPQHAELIAQNQGAKLTVAAWSGVASWLPIVLALCVFLFAYSTAISWSYYGERCWTHLFGRRLSLVYKLLFLVCCFLGSVVNATSILDFSDMMILSMALPNILGLYFLSGRVRHELDIYWTKLNAGDFELARR